MNYTKSVGEQETKHVGISMMAVCVVMCFFSDSCFVHTYRKENGKETKVLNIVIVVG